MKNNFNLTSENDLNNLNNIIFPVIQEVFKEEIKVIKRFETGLCHYVYDIILQSGKNVVFRIGSLRNKSKIEGSVYWYKHLNQLNIKVPTLIYKDVSCKKYPLPFTISERLNGDDIGNIVNSLTDNQLENIAKEIATIQIKVSTLKLGNGYGESTSYENSNLKDSWKEYIFEKINISRNNIIKANIFDAIYVDKVKNIINNYSSYFDKVEPIPFFDDITSKNIIIDNGNFSGVVDFDTLTFGDKLYWLGLCNMAFIFLNKENYINYLLKYLSCSEEDKSIMYLYTLIFCIDFMSEIGHKFNKDVVIIDENKVKNYKEIYDKLIYNIEKGESKK